jgi:hypothetical protein
MNTASSPDSRPAHVVRPAALLLALAFVALVLLVVLGWTLDASLGHATDEPLLGPFRWVTHRAMA